MFVKGKHRKPGQSSSSSNRSSRETTPSSEKVGSNNVEGNWGSGGGGWEDDGWDGMAGRHGNHYSIIELNTFFSILVLNINLLYQVVTNNKKIYFCYPSVICVIFLTKIHDKHREFICLKNFCKAWKLWLDRACNLLFLLFTIKFYLKPFLLSFPLLHIPLLDFDGYFILFLTILILNSSNALFVLFFLSASKESEVDRKKREREEKRLQRQQELAQKREARKGGAMKLGVKKLSNDWYLVIASFLDLLQ